MRARLAFVVPKHGRRIVDRNRVKRRLREAARTELLPRCLEVGAALDIVIRARPSAYSATFEELRGAVGELADDLCSHES